MLQDRGICDNAANIKDHEFRLRSHSFEMQRSIEALVEARDHAREEAIAFRRSEEPVIDAASEARGRG